MNGTTTATNGVWRPAICDSVWRSMPVTELSVMMGQPFAFDVGEAPYAHLADVVEAELAADPAALGRGLQPVRRPRTAGVPELAG